MIHLRLPDVFDEFWGLSPLYVLMKYGDIDVQATDFLRSYFLNRDVHVLGPLGYQLQARNLGDRHDP